MSTAMTRKTLGWFAKGGSRHLHTTEEAQAASAEVAAIQHAAQVITNPVAYTTDDWLKAWGLMKALAKEAT